MLLTTSTQFLSPKKLWKKASASPKMVSNASREKLVFFFKLKHTGEIFPNPQILDLIIFKTILMSHECVPKPSSSHKKFRWVLKMNKIEKDFKIFTN